MISLRPYQQRAVDEIRHKFREGKKKVVLCLPTGGGKTVVFSYMVAATLAKDHAFSKRILIITDRAELLQQAGGTLSKFDLHFEPITAKTKYISEHSRVYVAMVETLFKRLKLYPFLKNFFDLIIIDEAHKGNFKKLFSAFENQPFIIGATATPVATSKADPMKNYYNDIVCPVQIPELVEDGFLVPAHTYGPKLDRSDFKTGANGDFSEASQMEVFAKRTVYEGLFDKWKQFCDGTKTVIFNVNVKHSMEVCSVFTANGYDARHIDGETPKAEREKILAAYKAGEFDILCNCGILCAGWDEPSVRTVVVNRATNSKSLWLQMCGRGSRLYPGKEHFTILDMGGNARDPNLGLWESEINWTEVFFKKPKKKKDGAAPVKECPACGNLIQASAKVCKGCSYEFPEKEKQKAEDVEFERITAIKRLLEKERPSNWHTFTVEELVTIQEEKGHKVWWIVRILDKRNESDFDFDMELQELAELKGYHGKWVEKAFDYYRPAVAKEAA